MPAGFVVCLRLCQLLLVKRVNSGVAEVVPHLGLETLRVAEA